MSEPGPAARVVELAKAAPSIEGFGELAALARDEGTWNEVSPGAAYDEGHTETYHVRDEARAALDAWVERDPALFVALLDDPVHRPHALGQLQRKAGERAVALLDSRARDRPHALDDLIDVVVAWGYHRDPIVDRVVASIDAAHVPDAVRRARLVEQLARWHGIDDRLAHLAVSDPDGTVRAYACTGLIGGVGPRRSEVTAQVLGAPTPPTGSAWWWLASAVVKVIRERGVAPVASMLDATVAHLVSPDGLEPSAGWVVLHAILRSPADRARLAPRLAGIRAAHDELARAAIALATSRRPTPLAQDQGALDGALCTAALLATPAELAALCDLEARGSQVPALHLIAARGDAAGAAFAARWRPLLASLHALAAAAAEPGQWYRFDVALALGARADLMRFVLELARAPTFPNLWGGIMNARLPLLVRDHVPRGSELHARLVAIANELAAERPGNRDVRAVCAALAR